MTTAWLNLNQAVTAFIAEGAYQFTEARIFSNSLSVFLICFSDRPLYLISISFTSRGLSFFNFQYLGCVSPIGGWKSSSFGSLISMSKSSLLNGISFCAVGSAMIFTVLPVGRRNVFSSFILLFVCGVLQRYRRDHCRTWL